MKALQHGCMAVILSCLFLTGCSTWPSPPPMSQPYFLVDAGEAKPLHALAKKQEALAPKCVEHNSCEHVYFLRALLGLYESRESAIKYFEKVIAVAPKSNAASTSRVWLQLLQHRVVPVEQSWVQSVLAAPAISENQAILALASDRLVRDLLDRELAIQQLRTMKDADAQTLESLQRELAERERKLDAVSGKRDSAKGSAEPGILSSLQRQLTDRDKKIDELTSQLEALKRIDQEMRDKVRPIRPPSTVAPPLTAPEQTIP
jgi:Skp family chaperone for outer membrane proteins